MTRHAFICDAIRTPFGRFAGALSGIRTGDLAVLPLRALMARHPAMDWEALDDVMLGCANQAGEDNRNVARMALLLADEPIAAKHGLKPRARMLGMATTGRPVRPLHHVRRCWPGRCRDH